MFFHFLSISSLVFYFDFPSFLMIVPLCVLSYAIEKCLGEGEWHPTSSPMKKICRFWNPNFNYLLFFVWIFLSHLLTSVSLSIIKVIEHRQSDCEIIGRRKKSRISFVGNSIDLARISSKISYSYQFDSDLRIGDLIRNRRFSETRSHHEDPCPTIEIYDIIRHMTSGRSKINSRLRHHLVSRITCILVAWMTCANLITCWENTFKTVGRFRNLKFWLNKDN